MQFLQLGDQLAALGISREPCGNWSPTEIGYAWQSMFLKYPPVFGHEQYEKNEKNSLLPSSCSTIYTVVLRFSR